MKYLKMKKNAKTRHLLLLFLFAIPGVAFSKVKLPALFANNMVLQQKDEVAVWGWADEEKSVTVSPSWNEKSYKAKVNKNGKWSVKISTPAAGGPYELVITGNEKITLSNVLIGEVWLCSGQSNMEMPMKGFRGEPVQNSNIDILKAGNDLIRFISVPRKSTTEAQHDFEGAWKTATPVAVANFSATGYYFGRLLHNVLNNVPVGLIDVTYGGSNIEAWMDKKMLEPYDDISIPAEDNAIKEPNRTPTVLYNGMLNPVIGYSIKGCIWYQGESNADKPDQYELLFPDMVREWRARWGQGDFPFYYAQIAPFDYSVFYPNGAPEKANSAYLRDAQRKSQYKIPNSGMAVLLDVGNKKSIHPSNKKVVGQRLAYWALAKTYGMEGFGYASPDHDQINIQNDTAIVVTFKNIPNGITSYSKEVTAFEIAGSDGEYFPAKAIVRRKSVVLSAPQVKAPVAVRYAFKDYVEGQLFSNEGLPVTSFRAELKKEL